MKILSIETSCDETAISLVEVTGEFPEAKYEVLGNALWSQIDIHREFGGVFPNMSKREHAVTLVPLLEKVVEESEFENDEYAPELFPEQKEEVRHILEREQGLADNLLTFHEKFGKLPVDLIAVTSGPGLEPALWVGVSFAKALAKLWKVKVVPVNHMEGHLFASVFDVELDDQLTPIKFPAVGLLISGGHTELVLINKWGEYEKIGQTRDDAVGEAYDKVARLLGLPYPGGPEISKKADEARQLKLPKYADLPEPMINSGDLDFSLSGLKTAVRYAVEGKTLSESDVCALARDFEEAITKVIVKKSLDSISKTNAKTFIVGGGVSANQYIKRQLEESFLNEHPDVPVYFPGPGLSTDNSLMIALAGHAHAHEALNPEGAQAIRAEGNKKHRQTKSF